MSTVKLQHPDLGTFKGNSGDGVEQFLGIQYATLKDRLSEPVVRTKYDSEVDATKHASTSHSAPQGFEMEVGTFIQNEIPKPAETSSDIDCLNLGITIPTRSSTNSPRKLPVFVWVHGGGFVVGASSWPHYDHGRLVKLASDNGIPMIGVGINYRLGLPGFLTSQELKAAGYKGNNFLRDQRAAFQWVKQHIAGFGGDPENVTVIGESAGAMAVTTHLFSQQPLFQRAFATGGTCLIRPAMPEVVHEGTYQTVCAALGIEGLSADERIKALLTLPMEDIMAKVPPSVQPNAIVDGDIVGTGPSYSSVKDSNDNSVPAKQWLKALAIGDSGFDASVLYWLMAFLKPLSLKFPTSAKATLASHPDQAEKLLSLYSFADAQDDESAWLKVLGFINDVSFTLGTLAFAKGFAAHSATNVFFFNEGNPWPGQFQGRPTHVLDVVFLFQNYNDKLPPAQRAVAQQLGVDFARFVSGKDPWTRFEDREGARCAKVYGPSGAGEGGAKMAVVQDALSSRETGRKPEIVEIADKVGWDTLGAVFIDFILGKHLG